MPACGGRVTERDVPGGRAAPPLCRCAAPGARSRAAPPRRRPFVAQRPAHLRRAAPAAPLRALRGHQTCTASTGPGAPRPPAASRRAPPTARAGTASWPAASAGLVGGRERAVCWCTNEHGQVGSRGKGLRQPARVTLAHAHTCKASVLRAAQLAPKGGGGRAAQQAEGCAWRGVPSGPERQAHLVFFGKWEARTDAHEASSGPAPPCSSGASQGSGPTCGAVMAA